MRIFQRIMPPMNELRTIMTAALSCALALPALAAVDRRTPVVNAVEKALPSVVNIGTERMVKVVYHDPFYQFRDLAHGLVPRDLLPPPITREKPSYSLGSGVVVDDAGYILTNYHVIEKATKVRIMLSDTEVYDAVFLAGDPLNDLALLKIDAPRALQAIAFAEDDDLLLGETVIALGNPFGFSQTVTVGVLSGINREASYDGRVVYRDILQTDAAVNYGNSGGPLVNLNGELIGVNVQVLQSAQNIGFAVPVKRARALLGRWLSARQIKKDWLGFEPAASNGVLFVERLDPDGPAARAGLRDGMRIVALDGEPVRDLFAYNRRLLPHTAGDEVRLTVEDGDGRREVALRLAALPALSGDELARRTLGLALSTSTPPQAVRAGFRNGLGVDGVLAGSPAELSRVRPGLLLTRIDDDEIRTMDDVARALDRVQHGDKVTLKLVNLIEQQDFIVAEVTYRDLLAN